MAKQYAWQKGVRKSGSAQGVGTFLDSLRRKSGGALQPEDVVAAARPKRSPLHRYFEWDNTRAAEQYRLKQARNLLQAVVTIIDDGKSKRSTRAFVSLMSEEDAPYFDVESVLSDDRTRGILLTQARRDMNSFRRKYRELDELASVFAAMESVA